MLRNLLSLSFLIIFVCCNTSSERDDTNSAKADLLNPNHELIDRAIGFYKEENYSEALLRYDSLINIDSTNGEYYFKRGYCKYMESDNEVEAIADFLKAIEFNYNNKQAAYLNIGTIHRGHAVFRSLSDNERIAAYDSALYFYNESLKIDPGYTKALEERKDVIENLKRLKH